MYDQKLIGKKAEQEALIFLQHQGLKFIKQNFQCYFGEIDLIMRDKDVIVFVEVRMRSRHDYGNALESITRYKINKLVKTANLFLQIENLYNKVSSRFDVITMQLRENKIQLEWIKNAFWIDG